MDLSLPQAVAGPVVGAAIGLTGVGGGARLSAVAPDRYGRPALTTVLVSSGSKLLGV